MSDLSPCAVVTSSGVVAEAEGGDSISLARVLRLSTGQLQLLFLLQQLDMALQKWLEILRDARKASAFTHRWRLLVTYLFCVSAALLLLLRAVFDPSLGQAPRDSIKIISQRVKHQSSSGNAQSELRKPSPCTLEFASPRGSLFSSESCLRPSSVLLRTAREC